MAMTNTPSENTTSTDITVTDTNKIHIPEIHWEDTVQIKVENVPENHVGDTMSIDYFHGRPILYIWEPTSENVQNMIALPIESDPQTHTLISNGVKTGKIENVPKLESLEDLTHVTQPD